MSRQRFPASVMFRRLVLIILFALAALPINQAAYYLPAIIWNPSNPILQKQYWQEAVRVEHFDVLTFICAHKALQMIGRDSQISSKKLYHNLYVKEISPDIKNFDGACDTRGLTTIMDCDTDKFHYQPITVNTVRALPWLPTFQYGKDYMFFARSDGTKKSFNTTSSNCSMIFRIHFVYSNETRPKPSCSLFGRKRVCENEVKPTIPSVPIDIDCTKAVPQEVDITNITDTTIGIKWQKPNKTRCNITFYSISYRESEDGTEILVPSSQSSAILKHLGYATQYRIRMRAHMCQGSGDYSEEILGKTSGLDVVSGKRKASKEVSIDVASICIGIAVGIAVALCLGFLLWRYITRRQKCKEDKNKFHTTTNTELCQDDNQEKENERIALNVGYRESGQNWKLPKISEDHALYSSDA